MQQSGDFSGFLRAWVFCKKRRAPKEKEPKYQQMDVENKHSAFQRHGAHHCFISPLTSGLYVQIKSTFFLPVNQSASSQKTVKKEISSICSCCFEDKEDSAECLGFAPPSPPTCHIGLQNILSVTTLSKPLNRGTFRHSRNDHRVSSQPWNARSFRSVLHPVPDLLKVSNLR